MQAGLNHRGLRAPDRHGEFLIHPAWDSLTADWQQNRHRLRQSDFDLCGRPAGEIRRAARQQMLQQALEYSSEYRDLLPTVRLGEESPVVLTGHQPELFHAGVWFKNFVLHRVSERLGAVAVHLVIDNDVSKTTSIWIPTLSGQQANRVAVAFDRPLPHVPLEERQIVDPELFATFGARATAMIQPLISQPLLRTAWPWAVAAGQRTQRLARALAQMRHQVEAQCGLRTLELPLSAICDAAPFLWFVADLLLRAPQVRVVHNRALLEYRQLNRLRSKTHPVPELQQQQSWCETPLWIWDAADLHRRRLFVRQHQGQLQIWDLDDASTPRSVGRVDDAAAIAASLADWRRQGLKIRPRALATTLYARLFLCDLFVHGIGGARYDELTDVLIRQLFGVPAPAFVTATATVHLPIDHPRVSTDTAAQARQLLRGFRFHPERYLSPQDRQRAEVYCLAAAEIAMAAGGAAERSAQSSACRDRSSERSAAALLAAAAAARRTTHAVRVPTVAQAELPGITRVCLLPLSSRNADRHLVFRLA